MENNKKESGNSAIKAGGLLFAGCLFLGMAGGYYFGNMLVGLFAGMGLGFILKAVINLSEAQKK